MTIWAEIDDLLAAHGGESLRPPGVGGGRWKVPTEDGGSFLVEIVLRPKFCTVTVDRHHASPRDASGVDWINRNVGSVSGETVRRCHSGPGVLIIRPSYATVFPIPRERLLQLLDLWVRQEKLWAGVEATI